MNARAGRAGALLAAAGCLLAVLASAAEAQRRQLSGPYLVRITAVRGPRPASMRALPLASWKVNRGRDIYEMQVTKLDVLTGNTAYFNIVNRLDFYSPAFSIAGDPKAVEAFINAPDGQALTMMGYLRIESANRILMLDSVVNAPEQTPKP